MNKLLSIHTGDKKSPYLQINFKDLFCVHFGGGIFWLRLPGSGICIKKGKTFSQRMGLSKHITILGWTITRLD